MGTALAILSRSRVVVYNAKRSPLWFRRWLGLWGECPWSFGFISDTWVSNKFLHALFIGCNSSDKNSNNIESGLFEGRGYYSNSWLIAPAYRLPRKLCGKPACLMANSTGCWKWSLAASAVSRKWIGWCARLGSVLKTRVPCGCVAFKLDLPPRKLLSTFHIPSQLFEICLSLRTFSNLLKASTNVTFENNHLCDCITQPSTWLRSRRLLLSCSPFPPFSNSSRPNLFLQTLAQVSPPSGSDPLEPCQRPHL